MKKIIKKTQRFDSLNIHLASPEEVLSWSFGEVTKPETINYRTQRPERDGLFCEKIFGPENDFQCSCGKYKGIQYQGIECSNCGVEITRGLVRRERMGHLDLAVPVAHYWFLRKTPSQVATLLGLPAQQVQNVVYFSSYYVTDVDENQRKKITTELKKEFDEKLKKAEQEETQVMLAALYADRVNELGIVQKGAIIEEVEYERLNKQFPDLFKAEKGGEVIYNLLKDFNLEKKEKEIIKELESANKMQQEKLQKQLLSIRSFIQSNNRPEWMFLTRLPVIPPGIRPVLLLDSGQPASSDLNDLYRAVIIRNNRLKDFIATKTPQIFINTEKRLLQEAVDALFEKTTGSSARISANRGQSKQLKPISEYLSGKTGYFRTSLLGKRVDFSGRSVIVAGPHLKLDEFGLPKKMALEIFRPFVIGEALEREVAYNVRGAQRLIDTEAAIVWEMLEKVIQNKFILLNRPPTLHRQSIMAFKPILIEGLAIELNPLVCSAYNADFDGDTMTIHLPLSEEAQEEARNIMISTNNIITPASGSINVSPATQDILLGCYWSTVAIDGAAGEGRYFASVSEAITAHDFGVIDFRAKIKVLTSNKVKYGEHAGKIIETTVGRLRFNMCLPKEYLFINETVTKKMLNKIIEDIIVQYGQGVLVEHLDTIKNFGFKYASKSGTTFSWDNLRTPKNREQKIQEGYAQSQEINRQYQEGYISLEERKKKNIALWQSIKEELTTKAREEILKDSSISNMIKSGARSSFNDLGEMTTIFGIVESASGDQIEQPIISSMKNGMSPIEFFNASYGARKVYADTALKTADAGFLSRKLFSVAQEVMIEGTNCKTTRGFRLYRKTASGLELPFSNRIRGRYVAEEVVGSDGAVILKKGGYLNPETAMIVEKDESITSVKVRSPVTCQYTHGVCVRCYGEDRSTKQPVDLGESIGTIAAQSVGEPGTQLTMNTRHGGGVAGASADITTGLPRITEIFERRIPKVVAVIAHVDGTVEKIEQHPDGSHSIYLNVGAKKVASSEKNYTVAPLCFIKVKVGDVVKKGQFLTDGAANLEEMLSVSGKEATQEYIFSEVSNVYELQGINIAPVHFEIIIRQMFSQLRVTDPGDGTYTVGELIELGDLVKRNEKLEQAGKAVIQAENIISGITNISISRNNFLSAASFMNTTSVLIRASINGAKDTLDGVKENVIIGRLVPIGSGYEGSKKFEMVKKIRDDVSRRIAEKKEREAETK